MAALMMFPPSLSAAARLNGENRRAVAGRLDRSSIDLDGRLDDDAWRDASFTGGFIQKDPAEGEPSTEETQVAFLYDDHALYVGAKLLRKNVDNIVASVSRRDKAGNSERIIITLDTYHDRRTSYSFAVTATGVRIDYYHSEDDEGERDYSYDPVWEARADVNETGWTAEMRIPFSQLRFREEEELVWGLNMNRWMPAENEDTYWIHIPKNETGWASRFGTLEGIRGVRPSRRIELQPYFAGEATFMGGVDSDDPFRDGSDFQSRSGGDLKMGVGPNMTVDVTVNPDFGQVEADPATVNLSAFEVFFDEKRPFFIEGSQLLEGNGPNYFYSRRIGGPPHGGIAGDAARFSKIPNNSSIIAASKLTGRLASGLSIGVLGAATAREYAEIDSGGEAIARLKVEPRTGYGVLRAQREIGGEQSTVGVSLTGVRRDFQGTSELMAILNRQAYAGGGDWNLRFRDGTYELNGHVGFSYIEGDSSAIVGAQRSSRRYYQRPDADYVEVDSSSTSLTGYVASTQFEKVGGNWFYSVATTVESPGFEINDAGRLGDSDEIVSWGNLQYRQTLPAGWYRNYRVGLFGTNMWNYGGTRTFTGVELNSEMSWKNFWSSWAGIWTGWRADSDNLTRGGPLMKEVKVWNAWLGTRNNWAANTKWEVGGEYSRDEFDAERFGVETEFSFKVGERWWFSVEPEYRRETHPRQYITTLGGGRAETYGNRYIFSWIDRSTISAEIRLDYSLSPDLSLELYTEPFASSGRFYDYGELQAPGSPYLITYGEEGGTELSIGEDGDRVVTDGDDEFDLENRDFNFLSFRSNAVLRWEWRRGSTLFLVWQQNREASDSHGARVGGGDLFDSFSAEGENFVAVKMTYWLPYD